METLLTVLQRHKTGEVVQVIRRLMAEHPGWHRTRLSRELCVVLNWRGAEGRLKDIACRSFLLKLERRGQIVLPPRQSQSVNALRNRCPVSVSYGTQTISGALRGLLPLQISAVAHGCEDHALFKCLLSRHHYLGLRNTVGENLKYLVRDPSGRPLACLLFGSAAWKSVPRDAFIGWDPQSRQRNLIYLTNNTRFLILPWVQVPHLASHVLAKVLRRLSTDWTGKYGHPIYLLETFVDRTRFRGVCYRAANWILTGQTKGRTRNDRYTTIHAPVKDVYVYPLSRHFRRELCRES